MVNYGRTEHATLGCGTLILIALIVLIFSGPGVSNLASDVRSLHSEVGDLKKAVEDQTQEIKRLREELNRRQPGKAGGANP
jgi:Sec-independent protein translocase protein TatA